MHYFLTLSSERPQCDNSRQTLPASFHGNAVVRTMVVGVALQKGARAADVALSRRQSRCLPALL